MTVMLPGRQVSPARYVFRAIVALVLIVAFSLWMVVRSTGALDSTAVVRTQVPTAAGLIQEGAPVRFNGIKVGEIGRIDAGLDSSDVELSIDRDALVAVPRGVTARVLPRTFFGDVYIQLLPREGAEGGSLADGDEITVDAGPDALDLYDIFTKMSDLIAEVDPAQLNVALAAVDKAIGGRGDQLGVMIDDWWSASRELESTVDRFIDSTPKFRAVVESLRRATPEITETLSSVSNVSQGIVEHGAQIGEFLAAASGFVGEVGGFLNDQRENLITVVEETGAILSVIAENPSGITRTLREANAFGKAGTVLFASGRFNITAVPTFSQPMPYTAADCPRYGRLRGTQCFGRGAEIGVGPVREPGEPNGTILNPPTRGDSDEPGDSRTTSARKRPASSVIDGTAERGSLKAIEDSVRPRPASAHDGPDPVTVFFVGPMVRGHQVVMTP